MNLQKLLPAIRRAHDDAADDVLLVDESHYERYGRAGFNEEGLPINFWNTAGKRAYMRNRKRMATCESIESRIARRMGRVG